MIKLGFIINQPTLGRVYVVGIQEQYVYMNSLASYGLAGFNERPAYHCYKMDLCTNRIVPLDIDTYHPLDDNLGMRDIGYQYQDVTIDLIRTLLDESANSKQVFQGLKFKGIDMEGHSLKKNYLGNAWVWIKPDRTCHTILELITYVEGCALAQQLDETEGVV